MKPTTFISILLIFSACASADKYKKTDATPPTVRKAAAITAIEPEQDFDEWLGKVCAFTSQQAATLLDATLFPAIHEIPYSYNIESFFGLVTLLSVRLENQGLNSHFIGEVSFKDGDTVDYIVRKCNYKDRAHKRIVHMTEWLEEAKVCGRVNAVHLLYTVFAIRDYGGLYSKSIVLYISRTKKNPKFYYIVLKSGTVFKVGAKEGCGL